MQAERLDWLVDIQEKASKIWAELECEPTGELAAVHSSTAIKTYIFSAENMTKLEESYKEVSWRMAYTSCVNKNNIMILPDSWKTRW